MAGTTTIQEPVDKVKKVYDAVSKKYDVGTLDEFKADMKDPKKNRKVYDVVSKDFDVGSYDTFQQDLGANGKKKDTGSPSPSDSSQNSGKTGKSVNTSGSNQPSDRDKSIREQYPDISDLHDSKFVDSVLDKNKDKNFVKRYLNPSVSPVIKNDDGSVSTHRMASSDNIAYPTIVQQPDGSLKQLNSDGPNNEAYKYAIKNKEFIEFKNEKDADWFATNGYKLGNQNDSGSNPKQVTANFKNNSLTASDVGKVNGDGITPDMVKNAINNNGKNLSDAKNAPSNYSSQYLVKQKQDVDAQIDKLSHQTSSEMEFGEEAVAEYYQKIEDLKNRSDYLNTELQKNYDYRMRSLVPELVDQIKSSITDDDFSPGLHTLKEKSVQRVASIVDAYLNKENDAVVNARISGDLNNKNRTYEDVTRQVTQQLNFIPIQKAVDEYKKDFSKVHPQFADAFNANDATKDYFSNTNFDDVKSKVEIDAKKSFIETKNRYWGDGGLFMKSKDMVRIQEHYAQLVDDGKMTEEVAKTQMDAEIKQNPALQKLQKNYENDVKKINQNARKQYDQYVIKGLQTKHPQYTIYKDNKIGLASMSEDDFNKLTDEYQKGADDIVKKKGAENNELWKKEANEKASNVNWFWSGLGVSMNGLSEGVSKGFFSLTGWGGDNVRHYEAKDIASPSISESDQVLAWNKEGLTAIKHPNYFLFMAGQAAPVVVGGAAVGLATRGAGVPDYIEWLINAGLYTGQSAVGTFSDLAGSRDKNGNIISENDAARVASDQAANDFLPNVVMMGLGSGTVFRAKNIIKPTIAGAIKEGIFGTAATYPLLLWQGTNDYFAVKQAQGYEPDMYDYMQSNDFRDNLMNGLVIGGGMSLLHAPMNLSKNIDNWTKMVHMSEGEFKNLIPQNYALGQEFAGNGNALRDALKLHIFNVDPEGLNEEGRRNLADLKAGLLYSTNLDRVIRQANLDPKNIKDLYQAHNLALADQHDYLSEQAAKEGNKSLSDIYKDKAKDYREQAKAAAGDQAKFTYLVNGEGHPIFMSDRSFKTLEQEGTIAKWQKDGTIQSVNKSDDPEFAQRYKDFVTAKDQATVEGGDVMDHAEKLIEENKDKLGGWYAVAKEHPDEFYNSVAGLVFGRNSDGSESNVPGNEKSAREQFGDDIVDLAKVMYPESGIKVKASDVKYWLDAADKDGGETDQQKIDFLTSILKGDSGGEEGSPKLTEEAKPALQKAIETLNKLKEGGPNATTEGQGAQQKSNQPSGEQEHTRTGAPREEETQSRSDRGDSGTDGAGQIAPEDNITVSEMLDKKGTYKGQRGTFTQDGQAVIFKVDNSNREYELGNINEVGQRGIHEFGIDQEKSVVDTNEAGNIVVRGKEYLNKYSDPLAAINYDKDGNLVSVTLDTPDGEKRTFRGPIGEDIAYQITLKQISHEQPAFEDFINSDEDARKEMDDAGLSAPAEEKTTDDDETVPRIKIEPETVTISSPIKTESDEKAKEAEKTESDRDNKDPVDAVNKKALPPKTPPPETPPEPAPVAGTPKEEFTGNTKAKNREIEGAEEIFRKQGVIHWSESFSNALSHVMAKYPDRSWYEALKNHVNHFVGLLDAGVKFNPLTEDHAAFLMLKHETFRQLGMLEGWDSPDDFQRQLSDIKQKELLTDLLNVVRVTNPGGETGRSLQILQAEIAGEAQNGLKIRRMDLVRQKGAPLNKEELESSAEDWEKERAQIQKEHELELKNQKEKFEKHIARLSGQIARLSGEKPAKFNKEKAAKVAVSLRGFADRVEKFSKADLPEGTQRMGADIQKKVADAIRWIAEKIEKGDIRIPDLISAALDKFKGEKDEDELRDAIYKGMTEAGVDEKTLKNETSRKTAFDKIKTMAEADGARGITTDMVAKNLIRDYVKSHVGLTENSDIIGKVTDELKTILPDVDENEVRRAYLKEDEFKQPTKKEVESSLKESQRKFDSLTKLDKDIADLKEKQTLFKRGSTKSETPFDKDLDAKEKEKNAIMGSLGVKVASEDKYTKASYDLRAKSHNQRLENLSNDIKNKLEAGGLTKEQEKQLLNLKGKIDNSTVNLNPNSAESQDKTLAGALQVFKSIGSEFSRNTEKDIYKLGDIRRGIQRVIDGFDSDKTESTQDIKLKRAIDAAKRDMKTWWNKLSNGEFEDNPIIELTKTNSELIKAQRERDAIYQLYKDKQKKYQKQRKEWAKKTGDFLRAAEVGYLIGSPFTIAKVGASALLRPQLEALSKLGYHYTVEQLPFELNRILTERAKLGGESTSLASIRKGYQAYLMQYGEEGLKKLYAKANERYEKASQAFVDQEAEVNRIKYMGMDKPEYKDAVKKLQKVKNEKEEALVDAVGNSIYQFIAGSSIKESLEVFLHRSTSLERNFGDFDREAWDAHGEGKLVNGKSLTDIDNWNYLINGVGRSHAALKNFSGRFSFATGFMARLEAYSKEGVDISKPEKLLEIAHESYNDWERGKYQESNWISDKWNKLTRDIEKNNPEMAYLLRADVAITRVPVNMLYEGIMEYTLGGITGSVIAAKEYYKARKMTLQYQFGPEEQAQFKQELHDQLRKMDPKAAAAIVRAYRKQGFGLGMYALFVLGHGAFGGFAHKGQSAEDKKKSLRELRTGNPEIKTGEIKLGDWTMPNAAAKIIEHTPGFQLPLMALGLNQVYENSIVDGKSTPAAVKDAALAHINHVINSIPQLELVEAIGSGIGKKIEPSGQWTDVDRYGNTMQRKAFEAADYFKYLNLPYLPAIGDKGNILSEAYYKKAVKAQTDYRNAITEVETNTSLSKQDKEDQRRSLLKELDETIDEIYKENKENPQ